MNSQGFPGQIVAKFHILYILHWIGYCVSWRLASNNCSLAHVACRYVLGHTVSKLGCARGGVSKDCVLTCRSCQEYLCDTCTITIFIGLTITIAITITITTTIITSLRIEMLRLTLTRMGAIRWNSCQYGQVWS